MFKKCVSVQKYICFNFPAVNYFFFFRLKAALTHQCHKPQQLKADFRSLM